MNEAILRANAARNSCTRSSDGLAFLLEFFIVVVPFFLALG
jgi:hypothetical protein